MSKSVSTARLERIRFFQEHAGYCLDHRMIGARNLADAEELATELGLGVQWELEQDDWMEFAGDPAELYRRNFESGKWECFNAYIQDDCGNVLASLGGIILNSDGSSDDYRQVVEAELFQEAINSLKAAS